MAAIGRALDDVESGEGRTVVIEGKTNAEIAQQLFVTRRTVETHLTHAYQKLDIQGRAQLAPAVSV